MIGERVKKYRTEKGLSITGLADKAGVAKSYISALERNIQQNPSIQLLEKIADVLNISVDHLIKAEVDTKNLDHEWAELVKEAMGSGVSKEQFKEFLEFNKWKNKQN
ncbi:helix-turn-helix domain-containing protein [Fictibacillus norfolkensis]|uniref:Helix-turn-helix domain-containing protein n=1 Tax=Fictibacillus norfolkensis TaxID=2762233 RepID=A0ABR8SNL6_9BACL|nr:helix-turn-helix domain-containing protein [Fictibacillus norfolkensis]MBD7964954.1 helix-turn-helix domain-containing protein [Fictibacillus norfolkensis]